jgi:hypothetical protein
LRRIRAEGANRFKFKANATVLVGRDLYAKPLSVLHQTKLGARFFRIMLKPTFPPQRRGNLFLRRPGENHSRPGDD